MGEPSSEAVLNGNDSTAEVTLPDSTVRSPGAPKPRSYASEFLLLTGGVFVASFGVGFLRIRRKDARMLAELAAKSLPVKPMEPPSLVALQALGLASLITVGTMMLGVAAVRESLHIDTVPEFAEKMREIIPRKTAWLRNIFGSLDLPKSKKAREREGTTVTTSTETPVPTNGEQES